MSIAQESSWTLPTTIDGQPDLQGVWGNNTITPVERPTRFGERQYLTDEEQTLLERRVSEIFDSRRLSASKKAPFSDDDAGTSRRLP